MADIDGIYERARSVGLSQNERILSDRMMRLENTMGDMAAAQKAQMDRLVDMFNSALEKKKHREAKPEPAAAGAASSQYESVTSVTGSDDDEWKDFLGAELWKKEKDRVQKNPFDQRNYGKKGKDVETFEQLVVVQYKTMSQLLDLKYDLRGIANMV